MFVVNEMNGTPRAAVRLGTAGWSYFPDWVGPFYPPGTSPSDALARYVEAFPFVEIDSTFYAAPARTTVERWANIVPADFRVSCKAPKELVQDTGLRPPDIPFGSFCGSLVELLGARLGCVVVQMPPSFARSPENEVSVRAFLGRWASVFPLAVEFRHRSWRHLDVEQIFRSSNVALVSHDLRDVPGLEPVALNTSSQLAYIRLIGRHDGIGKDRIVRPQVSERSWWVDRIAKFAEQGVRSIFVVVNNHWEGHAPATLRGLRDALIERCDPHLDIVDFVGMPDGQGSLF